MTKVMISLPTSLLTFLAIEQMDMGRDITAFRERFKAYKNGKSVSEIYDAGLPRYAGGTPGLTKAQQAALDELYEWGNSLGYDTMSIAGIGGNGLQESGLNYNAKSKSGYAGFLQNNKNIQQAIIEQYGDYSPASQRQYIHDWNTRAKWITKGKHSPHTATNSGRYKIKGYTSTDEASDAWMKLYERPVILDSNGKVIGYQEQDKRRAYTKLAYEYLNSKYGKPQIPAQEPSPYIAKPVSTAVRPTIPAEQTVPTYDTKISPYISGKPMVKLRPRVQLPNLIELMEDSEWEPGFPGLKNGKLPGYKIGHNVSNAKLNEDSTFTDDYTKVFEDMYVTPQKTDLKRGSYTLNNFPYYLQHRTDWMKPFMSSGTNEKGLELIHPEFDLLLGGRQLATELIPAKIRPITKQYDNAWDRHYFKALSENDLKGAENLREAHFRVKAPNTKIKERQYHSVSDEYNPNFNSFDTKASGVESSIYTTDDPIMSGNYTKELVSEKELNNIIEETRQQYIDKLAKNRPWTREGKPFFMDDRYWTYADPKKAKAQILKDFKWLNNPIHPERQKQLYVNLENPFIIDAKNKYWSHFDYEDFPKDIQNVIRADMHSDIYHPYTTRSIERAQKQLGYDGAIINNVIDYGGRKQFLRRLKPANVIQINDPKNIKYADTVVYDDNGNIIPLSLRDNFEINDLRYKNGKLPYFSNGKSPIHIKPANRGKFTALKKRTGHSASWFKENGTPEQKKMAVFELNSKHWNH